MSAHKTSEGSANSTTDEPLRLIKSRSFFCPHFSSQKWSVPDNSSVCLLVKVYLTYLLLRYVSVQPLGQLCPSPLLSL